MLISPAKTLDFESPIKPVAYTQAAFLEQAEALVTQLRELAPAGLATLMKISEALAGLNVARYQEWSLPFTPQNARQAILAFAGDVYEGLDAGRLEPADLEWSQSHLAILSGLYGMLRPLDLIQPYRLEMGTRFATSKGKDLYAWWGDTVQQSVDKAVRSTQSGTLINLASEEYFKVVRAKQLQVPIIHPVFEDWKGQTYKVISFYAKRARGLMVRYAIQNRVENPDALKKFDLEGYTYSPEASNAQTWVFRRRHTDGVAS